MTLKLALHTTALLSPHTGIGQYVFNLAKEFIKDTRIDVDFFYSLYWNKVIPESSPNASSHPAINLIKNHIPYAYELRRILQSKLFRSHTKRKKFNIYHEPNYLLLPFNGPKVVTVHDLSWIHYPELHPIKRVRALNKYFEKSLAQSTYIITDSEFIRQEVIDLFNIAHDRIQSIPLGVESIFKPYSAAEVNSTLNEYQLQYKRFFLTVATLEPRKNLELVLRAYSQLPRSLQKYYPLIVIGMKGWHTSSIDKMLRPLLENGSVRLLGYIPRQDLATLVASSKTLIYPSLYEGFGLPPLEAMACGVPPIVSNVSSLPEVVQQGGIQINPHDDKGLANAIEQLVDDENLYRDLSLAALKQAQPMTWKNCADQTYLAYQKTIGLYGQSSQ